MKSETQAKYEALQDTLREMSTVIVAYSGGVDSAMLLKVAYDTLGEGCTGVLAISESYPASQLGAAVDLAGDIGARLVTIRTEEMSDPRYVANDADRCYYCKTELWLTLTAYAANHGSAQVLDGSNADDAGDYRPGRRALAEQRIRSPLMEVGLRKEEIREISRELGLPTWSRPAMACLSSRIPYGSPIQLPALRQIDAAEDFIRGLGFDLVRVRYHDHIARIEVDESEIARFTQPESRRAVDEKLKDLGFMYVTLDLRGYRMGSMNEMLSAEVIAAEKAG